MGLSVSASFAILTVSFLIGAAALVDAAFFSLDTVMKGAEDAADWRMEWAKTRFVVDNATFNGTLVIVNLTNTGSASLHLDGVSVLVNGSYVGKNLTNATVGGKATNLWAAQEKLRMELNITASTNERVAVATGNGVMQYGVIA